jgi:3',5'-cyclic AMP phosphodiesterase CpdA
MASDFLLSRRFFTLGMAGLGASTVVGCSSSDAPATGGPVTRETFVLPPLSGVELTTERTIVPGKTRLTSPDARSPMNPEARESLLADGFGSYEWGPGEPVQTRLPPGASTPPAAGPSARRLVRLVHVTDIHIADDESPTRMELFDGPRPMDGAARPQAPFMGRILNAAVRTVNALNANEPVDFVLATGDVTDSAQKNEVTWFLQIMDGVESVACDSGDVNDPEPGTGNDPKDPFRADGLAVPWFFALGNHDALVMGINAITPQLQQNAMGDNSAGGFTDWTQPGGVVRKGEATPDENRKPLMREEMVPLLASAGGGHGVAGTAVANRVCYTMDVEGTPLRFIVHDTAAEGGGASGVVRKSVVDAFLRPALEAAKAEGKWVILASHHGISSLSDGSDADSETKADAMPPADVLALFASYGNVILSITGHTHEHVVEWLDAGNGKGYWEVQTSSLVEFPNQMRLVEITDEDNGYLSVQLVGIDFGTEGDDVAEQGRVFAILDHTSGWGAGSAGTPADRNVKLYVAKLSA